MNDDTEIAAQRLGDLVSRLVEASGTRAQDFLILTNAGGVVACLGLITSSSPHGNGSMIRILLAMYIIGLALVGWTSIRGFLRVQRLAMDFATTMAAYRAGEVEWSAVADLFAPKSLNEFAQRGLMIGAASLVVLIAATITSCVWLLYVANGNAT